MSSQQPTPARASRELAAWTRTLKAFLLRAGAREGELTLQPIATETVTADGGGGEGGGRVTGYRLTRTVQLRSSRVSAIADLAERTSALLAGGVPLAAEPLQFVYTGLPSIRPTLVSEAARDAVRRAEALVRSTGGDLGRIRQVDVGVFQVTAPNSTEVSDYGVYDTSTREKDVTAVVNVTFALD